MKSRTLPSLITIAIVLFAFVVAIGSAAAVPSATRTLPASVSPGADFQVAISYSDIGTAGQVNETLPPGFTYVNSSLSSGVVTGTNWVKFTLIGGSSFTYNVTASGVAGTHTFAGTVKDFDKNTAVVGGDTELTVGAGTTSTTSRRGGGGGGSGGAYPPGWGTTSATPADTTAVSGGDHDGTYPPESEPEGEDADVSEPGATGAGENVTEPEPTPTPESPGFAGVFAILGILSVAYLYYRTKR